MSGAHKFLSRNRCRSNAGAKGGKWSPAIGEDERGDGCLGYRSGKIGFAPRGGLSLLLMTAPKTGEVPLSASVE